MSVELLPEVKVSEPLGPLGALRPIGPMMPLEPLDVSPPLSELDWLDEPLSLSLDELEPPPLPSLVLLEVWSVVAVLVADTS